MIKGNDRIDAQLYIWNKLDIEQKALDNYDDLIMESLTNEQITERGLLPKLSIARAELEAKFLREVTEQIAITPMAVAYAERMYQIAVTIDEYCGRDKTRNLALLLCALSLHCVYSPTEWDVVTKPEPPSEQDFDSIFDDTPMQPVNPEAWQYAFEEWEADQLELEDDLPF